MDAPRNSTFTLPWRTYFWMTVGSVDFSHALQAGHWMSAYSTSVTGASGWPSVLPCCGMPRSRFVIGAVVEPPAEPAGGVVVDEDEEPCWTMATAISPRAITTAAAIGTRMRARRRGAGLRGRVERWREACVVI